MEWCIGNTSSFPNPTSDPLWRNQNHKTQNNLFFWANWFNVSKFIFGKDVQINCTVCREALRKIDICVCSIKKLFNLLGFTILIGTGKTYRAAHMETVTKTEQSSKGGRRIEISTASFAHGGKWQQRQLKQVNKSQSNALQVLVGSIWSDDQGCCGRSTWITCSILVWQREKQAGVQGGVLCWICDSLLFPVIPWCRMTKYFVVNDSDKF